MGSSQVTATSRKGISEKVENLLKSKMNSQGDKMFVGISVLKMHTRIL